MREFGTRVGSILRRASSLGAHGLGGWAALALLVLLNVAVDPGVLGLEWRDGRLFGTPVDVLNHGSRVGLVALGMTLVIATGGIDLSVGAVMAISGAIASTLVAREGWALAPAMLAALGAGLAAGLWNGLLVGWLRVQAIVATLVLMVAGRGVAQLITGGVIVTFEHRGLESLASGAAAGLPTPVIVALAAYAVVAAATRLTALGMFLEGVGGSERAARYAGIDDRVVRLAAYACCGMCAAGAGLIDAAYIKAADANNAGLFIELDAILAVVIGGTALSGGRYTLLGTAAGALFIQALTTSLYMHDVSADVAPLPKALVVLGACVIASPRLRARLTRRPA